MESKLIVYNLIQMMLVALFYLHKFQVNKYLKCFLIAFFSYLYVMFFSFFQEYLPNACYLFMILYCVILVIELFINQDSISKKIRNAMIPHLVISTSILISLYVVSLNKYWVIDTSKVLKNDLVNVLCISIVLEIPCTYALIKQKYNHYYNSKDWMMTGIVVSFDFLVMVLTNITFLNKFSIMDWMMTALSILIIIFSVVYLVYKDDTKKTTEELNNLKHDLKHAVSMIKVNELEKELNEIFVPICSGNKIIDNILNQKLKTLLDHGIEYKCYVNITEKIKIKDEDFSMLLINMMDNCIEHCSGQNKFVSIELFHRNKNLVIKISNTIKEEVNKEKEFTDGHGFGLKSIEKTVNKYHGILKIAEENHNYCCGIVFFENE